MMHSLIFLTVALSLTVSENSLMQQYLLWLCLVSSFSLHLRTLLILTILSLFTSLSLCFVLIALLHYTATNPLLIGTPSSFMTIAFAIKIGSFSRLRLALLSFTNTLTFILDSMPGMDRHFTHPYYLHHSLFWTV